VNIELGKTFSDALGIAAGDLVSIAGAGGKTSLMYTLGGELAAAGQRILLTTTTKIIYPEDSRVGRIILGPETGDTMASIVSGLEAGSPLLAGRERQHAKIIGFSDWFVDGLHSQSGDATVISECDGAMGKSLKIPRGWEPILPSATSVYVVVVGADCLGRPLGSEMVFEPEALSALAGVDQGTEVNVRLVTRCMLAPESYLDRKPARARCCVFINKWDAAHRDRAGRQSSSDQDEAMALALDLKGASGVERVVLSSLKLGSQSPIMVIS
jgi:probable selenium-dependent hydroxylase accessory protein YqeC